MKVGLVDDHKKSYLDSPYSADHDSGESMKILFHKIDLVNFALFLDIAESILGAAA